MVNETLCIVYGMRISRTCMVYTAKLDTGLWTGAEEEIEANAAVIPRTILLRMVAVVLRIVFDDERSVVFSSARLVGLERVVQVLNWSSRSCRFALFI